MSLLPVSLGLALIAQAGFGTHTVKLNGPLAHDVDGDVVDALATPDGTRVVYRATASTTGAELFSVPANGGAVVQLTHHPIDVGTFRISGDGNWVVHVAQHLYSVPIDGSQPPLRLDAGITGTLQSFVLAPDSSRAVFDVAASGKRLYSASLDTAGSAVLLSDPPVLGTGVQQYEVTADSSTVVYRATSTTAYTQLWRVPIDRSSPPVMLNAPLASGLSVADFELVSGGPGVIYRAQESPTQLALYALPAGASAPVKLNQTAASVTEAHASADGSLVVYQAGNLLSVPIAGGATTLLASPMKDFAISPDSTRVLYRNAQNSLFSQAITGGTAHPVGNGVKEFTFSPDGARVLYRQGDTFAELFSVPVSGVGPVKLSPTPSTFGVPSFAIDPASGRVAFLRAWVGPDLFEVWSAPSDGSQPAVQLSPVAQSSNGAQSTGASSGLGIYVGDFELDNVFQLYGVRLDGSGAPLRLNAKLQPGSNVVGDVNEFVVSPGGGWVAYLADQEIDNFNQSFAVPADGGAPRKLSPLPPDPFHALRPMALAPDGRFAILMGRGSGVGQDLFRATTDGSRPLLALTGPSTQLESVTGPALLDATGTHVVYGSQRRLWTVPADGSAPPSAISPLVVGNGFENGPESLRLTADGTRVVFVLDRQFTTGFDQFAVYSVPIDGSQPAVRLHPEVAPNVHAFRFALSPDSTRVVFSARLNSPGPVELFSVPVDGSAEPRRISLPIDGLDVLTGTPAGADEFQIAPDGQSVVYIAGSPGPEGSFQLYAVPIEGGAGVRLNGRLPSGGDTLAFEPFCSPEVGCGIAGRFQITPDGRRVVYQADQRVDERFELFAAPLPDFRRHARLDRERSWRILAGAGSVADFEITPDGRTLVYLGFFQGLFALHRVPIEGGSPVRLTGGASLVGGVGERASFTLAPDGASALFLADLSSTHRYELFDVPLDGSHPPQRVNGPLPPNGDVRSGFRFGANGRVFYMADQARDEVVELYATGARLARRAELR